MREFSPPPGGWTALVERGRRKIVESGRHLDLLTDRQVAEVCGISVSAYRYVWRLIRSRDLDGAQSTADLLRAVEAGELSLSKADRIRVSRLRGDRVTTRGEPVTALVGRRKMPLHAVVTQTVHSLGLNVRTLELAVRDARWPRAGAALSPGVSHQFAEALRRLNVVLASFPVPTTTGTATTTQREGS